MYSWMWLVAGVGLMILELFIPSGFIILILGAAAVVVGILSELGLLTTWVPQAALFCVVALGTWIALGQRLQALLGTKSPQQGQVEGAVVKVTEPIAPGATGSGELWGAAWRIHNIGTEELPVGSEAVVIGSAGITLQVKRK